MFIGHPFGRRRTILLGDAFVIVGGSLQASSWSVPQIIIARVLCGFGIGFISCAVLTYMSEMSITKTERGLEAANQSIWLIGGVAFAYWLDFGFTQMDNQVSWRFPIALQSLFAFCSFCGMIMLPDVSFQ
jgi:MFS family permease